jgi:hypothetical protein
VKQHKRQTTPTQIRTDWNSHDCHQSRREFQQSVKQELQSQILLSAENWGQLHSIDLNSQPYAAAVQKLELEVCQVSPEMFWKLEDGWFERCPARKCSIDTCACELDRKMVKSKQNALMTLVDWEESCGSLTRLGLGFEANRAAEHMKTSRGALPNWCVLPRDHRLASRTDAERTAPATWSNRFQVDTSQIFSLNLN